MASVMVDRPSPGHGKLHKRTQSDTLRLSRKSPTMPPSNAGRPSLDFKRKITYEEASSPSTSSLKLKPYVRRTSAKDIGQVDLSRSMAENESLTGLGLGVSDSSYSNTYTLGPRSVSDVSFTPVRNQRHRRSTSGNSLISTGSNTFRQQPSTYIHPVRQTPQPYTPPLSKSYASTAGSVSDEDDVGEIPRPADESEALRRLMSSSSSEPFGRRSESFSKFPSIEDAQPVQSGTPNATSRVASPSQISLGGRSRGATLQSIDTLSPSSRPSLDKALNFVRGQRSNDTDTELIEHDASHAASIRAARQLYQEREEAKDRRAEKEELRQAERDQKKQYRKHERKRRKSEAKDHPTIVQDVASEKDGSVGVGDPSSSKTDEGDQVRPVERTIPARAQRHNDVPSGTHHKSKKRSPKSTWAIFLAWFRTRLLRIGR